MKLFSDVFFDKRVLITGHTGFKGSWLALWLSKLGANITGISLPPARSPNHWNLLNLNIDEQYIDIRDFNNLSKVLNECQPEIVFHLAAQSLVKHSYADPIATWSTNVMGTANVLEAARQLNSVKAIVVVTTDKCYANQEWPWGYREIDRLGGHDPYSASKAGAELVAASYRRAFFTTGGPLLATARAGNVIGGGDWSEDRLIPDIVRAITAKKISEIRSPNATRPWQHVLESLSGYLILGQILLQGDRLVADAWNFGPDLDGNRSVADLLNQFNKHWPLVHWCVVADPQLHETTLLYLDSSKARHKLNWQPVWKFETMLAMTAEWYRAWVEQKQAISDIQIDAYIDTARRNNIVWTRL